MFCPDCFKLLDDNNSCTNPACPSYVGSDESVVETNTIDENRMNVNTENKEVSKQPKTNTINEEIFKQPKINTVTDEIFKQPKINTINKEVSKQPKVNTINEEIFKQPKINTVTDEIFKQPKINTINKEVSKQPKVNTINEEIFKQPKVNTVTDDIFKQPKLNNINDALVGQANANTIKKDLITESNPISEDVVKEKKIISDSTIDSFDNDEYTKAVPIITESMLNNLANMVPDSEDEFTKAIPIITNSMLDKEEASKVTPEENFDLSYESDYEPEKKSSKSTESKQSKKKSTSKNRDTQKESTEKVDIKEERETPRLDDYFNDDLIDADEVIDNSDSDTVSEKEMLLAFVGKKNRTYYSTHIDTYLENPNFISFNPSAFFFTLWWFWHRKIYVPTAIIGAICLGSIFIIDGPIKLAVLLPIALFGGLLGNQIYLKSASKRIDKVKSNISDKNMDNRALLKLLRTEGGTTNIPIVVAIILVIAMVIALTFAVSFVARMLLGAGSL